MKNLIVALVIVVAFCSFIQAEEVCEKALAEAFSKADVNGDMLLDIQEVTAMARACEKHAGMSDEEILAVFNKFDADASGSLCLEEFKTMVCEVAKQEKECKEEKKECKEE